MNRLTDYAARMRGIQTPFSGGQQPVNTPSPVVQPTQPMVDTSDAMGSLAQLLGPTPAELEARQRKLEQGKAKMAAWTGLFDGLRQLGNLYYATKGATPQQFTDPYKQVEQTYQDATKRADDLDTYRRQYTQQLYNLRRQAGEDTRKDILAEAQANYYNTRDEVAHQNAELAKLKAIRVIKNTDGSLVKFDPVTGELAELSPADPLYIEYKRSQINKNNRTGSGGKSGNGVPYKEHYVEEVVDPATGKKIKKYVAGRYGAGASNTPRTNVPSNSQQKPANQEQARQAPSASKARTQQNVDNNTLKNFSIHKKQK